MLTIIGVIGLAVLIIIALAVAALTAWSGWRAVQDELVRRNFRSQPPRPSDLALTVLGVVWPVLATSFFLIALAVWLVGVIMRAL